MIHKWVKTNIIVMVGVKPTKCMQLNIWNLYKKMLKFQYHSKSTHNQKLECFKWIFYKNCSQMYRLSVALLTF